MPSRKATDTAHPSHSYYSLRKENAMHSQFTLGVEEEFQMVDRHTGQLVSHIHTILDKAIPLFGDFIKAERPQCSVEINTHICPNITALRLDLQQKQCMLAQLLEEDGLTFV